MNSAFLEALAIAGAFLAESIGTALLIVAVVGSGIIGDRLSGGNAESRSWRTRSRPATGAA